eukprot:Gb_15713 [translate_table: standard]
MEQRHIITYEANTTDSLILYPFACALDCRASPPPKRSFCNQRHLNIFGIVRERTPCSLDRYGNRGNLVHKLLEKIFQIFEGVAVHMYPPQSEKTTLVRSDSPAGREMMSGKKRIKVRCHTRQDAADRERVDNFGQRAFSSVRGASLLQRLGTVRGTENVFGLYNVIDFN